MMLLVRGLVTCNKYECALNPCYLLTFGPQNALSSNHSISNNYAFDTMSYRLKYVSSVYGYADHSRAAVSDEKKKETVSCHRTLHFAKTFALHFTTSQTLHPFIVHKALH